MREGNETFHENCSMKKPYAFTKRLWGREDWKLSTQSHRHKYTVMQPLLSALLIIQRV